MYFEIDTDMSTSEELGIAFVRSAEKEAKEYEAIDFLSSAFGALSIKQREEFLKFANEFHVYKKELEEKHGSIDTAMEKWNK